MNISIEKYVAPVQELAALNVANIEKLVNLQIESFEEFANASVDSLKKAAALKDLDSIKTYSTEQTEAAKSIYESSVTRTRSAAEIFQAYPADVKKIVEKSFSVK